MAQIQNNYFSYNNILIASNVNLLLKFVYQHFTKPQILNSSVKLDFISKTVVIFVCIQFPLQIEHFMINQLHDIILYFKCITSHLIG